ncbi:MAG: hypothetical protein K2Y33_00370, partial [Mycolicibacterium frederiksbergense]|nr:hypothetical protein [Mycolicibacterium frederiksbergense]
MESHYSAVVLSRGGTWKPRPDETPYLLPSNNRLKVWPEGATAECHFYGTDGVLITTVDGEVFPNRIDFIGEPEQMDQVPAGAAFTIVLDTNEGTFPIRHGKVIRREI